MFQHQGIWLPDGEKHFPQWMDAAGELVEDNFGIKRGTYQIKKWRACLPFIKERGAAMSRRGEKQTAVDVGAHVGFWSRAMLYYFYYLHAFEPMSVFRECWLKNMESHYCYDVPDRSETTLHACALGATNGRVSMSYLPADSGNTHVAEGKGGDTDICTLDSFELLQLDFIKIDCEGYEHHVVMGARDTLLRCKPCVIVEQKQHKMAQNYPGQSGTPAVDLLKSIGYKVRAVLSGDYILTA